MFFSFLLSIISSVLACENLATVPDALQIAWISPVREQVRPNEYIEVVSYSDLRRWLQDENIDTADGDDVKALLHQLGMLSKRSKKNIDPSDYKVVIFDIYSERLCRPLNTEEAGTLIGGVPVCAVKGAKPANFYSRHGFTGCGYTQNTQTMSRGFDVYRIKWVDASTWGFCVMPLERFLEGNPRQGASR